MIFSRGFVTASKRRAWIVAALAGALGAAAALAERYGGAAPAAQRAGSGCAGRDPVADVRCSAIPRPGRGMDAWTRTRQRHGSRPTGSGFTRRPKRRSVPQAPVRLPARRRASPTITPRTRCRGSRARARRRCTARPQSGISARASPHPSCSNRVSWSTSRPQPPENRCASPRREASSTLDLERLQCFRPALQLEGRCALNGCRRCLPWPPSGWASRTSLRFWPPDRAHSG